MLKNLLRDKDNEVEHYRKAAETIAAQAGGEIKVPPPPPRQRGPRRRRKLAGLRQGMKGPMKSLTLRPMRGFP